MAIDEHDVPALARDGKPALRSFVLPPIDRLSRTEVRSDPLVELVRRSRAWGHVPVPLSRTVVTGLWTMLLLNVGFGIWMLNAPGPCAGIVCTTVTLGGHRSLVLVLGAICVSALVVVAPFTRGLSRASGPQLALLAVATPAGAVAISGAVVVAVVAVVAAVAALGLFVTFVDRF